MSAAGRSARLFVSLFLGVIVALALGGAVAARGIDQVTAPVPQDCDPCPLSRVVVDQPAWDETVTVVDSPARTVHHHDLVTAEHTVAHQVLTTPAHDESYQLWVASGYWTQHWIDTSHWESRTSWVSSGYWQPYWVDTSYWQYQSYYVSQGYWQQYWVNTGGYWSCSGWGEDRECDYYGSGYWSSYWVDTSYWAGQYVWISSGYWNSYWVNTSHWEYSQVWVSSGYYQQQWISTGGYWATGYTPYVCSGSGIDRECDGGDYYSYWVATGYYTTNFWVDTSHYETRTRHVDDVYTTTYEVVPAVYRDWDEQIAAITHTAVVHHPAVTHLEPITPEQLVTQSRQSAAAGTSGTTSGADGTATAPTTIAVVSNITVVDHPAYTTTRTVVDRAAYDEPRTVVDRAAYDDSYNRPVWDYDCEDTCVRYIDYWETVSVHHDAVTHVENVHHDAVTHVETVDVPAVTHQETLRYDSTVDSSGSSDRDDMLATTALLLGLMALSGLGRYAANARDAYEVGKAVMAQSGIPLTPTVLADVGPSDDAGGGAPSGPLPPVPSQPPKPEPGAPPVPTAGAGPTPTPQPGPSPHPTDTTTNNGDALHSAAAAVGAGGNIVDASEAATKAGSTSTVLRAIGENTPLKVGLSLLEGALDIAGDVDYGDDLLTATGRALARIAGSTGGGAAGLAACGELMLDTVGVGVLACPAIVVESGNAGADFATDTYGHLIGYSPKEVADWKARQAAEPSPQRPPNDTEWNLARHGQSRVPLPGDLWGATMPSDEEIYHSFYVHGPDYGFETPHVSGRTADKLAAEEEAQAASDRSRQEAVDHQRSERDDAAAGAQPAGGDPPSDAPTPDANDDSGGSGITIDAGYVEPPAADQASSGGDDTGADFSAYTPDVGDEIEIAA